MQLLEWEGQLLMNIETKKRKTLMKIMVGTNHESQSLKGLNSCEGEGGGGLLPPRGCTLISIIGDSLVDDRVMLVAGRS